jgi:hypothetical protein
LLQTHRIILKERLAKETIKQLRIKYSRYFDGKMIDELADLFARRHN